MMTIRRILFPTDYSSCAESAFTHAAYLADHHGAQLHILHVVGPDREVLDECFDDFHITPSDIAADLDIPFTQRDDGSADMPVSLIEREEHGRDPAPEILRYAAEHDIDLIVMGTHGRRGPRRMMMGSVAEEVVRLAPCPVLTVHRPAEGSTQSTWTISRVLAPVDLSERSLRAARHAAALAVAYEADLDLLFVVEAPTSTTTMLLSGFGATHGDLQARAEELLGQFVETLQEEVPALQGRVTPLVRVGHPVQDTLATAEGRGTDLLVLGSHGRTGFQRFLLGSVAEQLIRLAPCPVFTLKSFGKLLVPSGAEEEAEPSENAYA